MICSICNTLQSICKAVHTNTVDQLGRFPLNSQCIQIAHRVQIMKLFYGHLKCVKVICEIGLCMILHEECSLLCQQSLGKAVVVLFPGQ